MENTYTTATVKKPTDVNFAAQSFAGKALKLMAQGLGTAVGGWGIQVANILIGFGLSFIKQDDPLGEAQLAELKQINQTLNGVRQDLGLLDTDLKGIEQTLEQILGQAKLNNWLSKENTIADALAHIGTDFQTYQGFMTPQSNGQLQNIPAAQIELLSARAYNSAGLTDEEAVTKIQQAIIGSGAGDGLLDLYVTLLIDYLNQKTPATVTSADLEFVADALIAYFARYLAYQLNGMAVVIECKNYDGIDAAILGQDWTDFLDSVKDQSAALMDSLWTLMMTWRNLVEQNQTSGSGGQFGLNYYLFDSLVQNYSNNDLLAFLSGGPVTGTNAVDWENSNYTSAIAAPEQDYLTKAENLVAVCFLPADTETTKGRRIVIHTLFYIGMFTNETTNSVFANPISLQNVSSAPVVEVRKAAFGNFAPPPPAPNLYAYWVRQVFDLTADGTYQMTNMNSSFPTWDGYYQNNAANRFQSDADLKLTATVNADNPVGVIRFVPYVQAA